MELSALIDSIISLFIMMMIGIYGSRKKILNSEIIKALTDILIQIALPFMIVASFIFSFDDNIKNNIIHAFYYSFAAYIIMAFISYILLIPIKKQKKTILHFANVFTNTGYVGFPILNSIYGPEGVIYGSIFNMFFVIFVWTYGLMLFKGPILKDELKKEIKKALLNPSIFAVIVGIIIMVLDFQLPSALSMSIRSIGNMTGPLSMLIIGAILSKARIKEFLKDWTIYYGISTKLIIIPLVIYLIFSILEEKSMVINTVIIMTAMPASAMTSIFAESYDIEKDYAALLVSSTTLLSLITIPIFLKIIT